MLLVHVARRARENRDRNQRRRAATLPYVLRRGEYGAFHALVQELADEDPGKFRNFLRMSPHTFDDLLRRFV